jgi:dolichyl-phosphate-mannose--protein O-mannosyl transferase
VKELSITVGMLIFTFCGLLFLLASAHHNPKERITNQFVKKLLFLVSVLFLICAILTAVNL